MGYGIKHRSFKNKFRGLTADDVVCATVSATCAVSATDIIAEVVVSSVVVSTSGDFIADNISATGNLTADNISATANITAGTLSVNGAITADGAISTSGNVRCDQLITKDNASIGQSVSAGLDGTFHDVYAKQNLFVTGEAEVTGNLTADNISATGNVSAVGAIIAGDVSASGNVIAASGEFVNGATGWFDDGANFRVYVSGGIITEIGNTVAGGHS